MLFVLHNLHHMLNYYVLLLYCPQHCVLFVKSMLAYMIPDTPDWVETELARAAYQSKKAWRKQVTHL